MKLALTAAAIAATLAVPLAASAQQSSAPAMYVCRVAASGGNAMMGSTAMTCRKVDMGVVRARVQAIRAEMKAAQMSSTQQAKANKDFNDLLTQTVGSGMAAE